MKFWIVLLLIVAATSYEVSAKSIKLEITPKRQEYVQWWDAKFQVRIVPVDGFDAQVYLRLTESTIPWNYIHAPATTIYPPYDQTFEITVSAAAWSFGGEQRIIVEALNGAIGDHDTLYVVAPQQKEWRRITPENSLLPDKTVRQILHDRD